MKSKAIEYLNESEVYYGGAIYINKMDALHALEIAEENCPYRKCWKELLKICEEQPYVYHEDIKELEQKYINNK
jgi:hypothetical protein